MIKINKKNVLLFLTLAMSVVLFSCKSSSSSGSVDSISSLTKEGGEWVLKIDDLTVYENKFNQEFENALLMANRSPEEVALLKNNERAKQEFLDGMISQLLLLNDPKCQEYLATEEAQDFLASAFRSLQVNYYTQKLMENAMNEVPEPQQQQIAAFYEQYKVPLAQQYGITELNAQTIPYLSQMLKSEQAQQVIMMSISDLKDKARIDRNKDIIGDIVPTIPGGQPNMGAVEGSEDGVLR